MWMFNLSSGWWTWLNGADPTNQRGVYVLQGVASVTNQPGARQFHSMVMHPSGGLMFLFGGYHNDYAAGTSSFRLLLSYHRQFFAY